MTDPTINAADAGQTSPSEPSQLSRASTSIDVTDMAPGTSGLGETPDMSDEESVDLDHQEHAPHSQSALSRSQVLVKGEPDDNDDAEDPTGGHSNMPVQKRRRVTRACDECRRKKIKCDGKNPCTHCSVYSYECTYDKPSNRRRNPAPQYIEALENKLQRAETLLRKFMPDFDLSDPNLDPTVQQEFRNRENVRAQAAATAASEKRGEPTPDAKIRSMIETIGQLDLGEDDKWDFHGISSGAVFLRRMKENFRGLLGHDYRTPFLPRPPRPPGIFSLESPRFESQKFDSPKSNGSSPFDISHLPNIYDLPPREKVQKLSYYTLNCATCLLRIVHQPTYNEMVDKLYDTPPETWGLAETRYLGLLYAVVALGSMYDTSEDNPTSPPFTYKTAIEEGIKYYTLARMTLQDVAECRDLTSLQALVFMIFFLQVSSNVSGCYAYLGIAMRSALRMGLHRHLPHAHITPIEEETRRRVFHVIRQMDTYISATLGFPMMLNDEDIDQPLPTEVDDEYITKEAILDPPPGTPSFFQAFNAHSRLMKILAKVIKFVYPLKGVEECVMNGGRPNATYLISYSRIKELEQELQDWHEALPQYWQPGEEDSIEAMRVRTLLRFGFAHVQMMLYRPFLHYVSRRLTEGKPVEDRYYASAAMGISVSRNIVHIGIEIRKQAVLIGPYWFIMYSQFFAILSLVFYAVENPDKAGSAEILADASAGREILSSLAPRSLAADRITSSLNILFEQLPERLKQTKAQLQPSRKRAAPSAKMDNVPIAAHPAMQENMMPQRRSEEMPRPSVGSRLPQRTSFDTVAMQQNRVPGQNFAANMQDLLPLDLSSTGASPESSTTPGTAHRPPGFQMTQTPGANALYKVDAMMFPTGDPFAYPAQPIMNFASPVDRRPTSQSQHQESLAFYGMYDDIEGQLLGPVPGYLQQGLDLSAQTTQMYHHSGMLILNQQQQQQLAQQRQQREMNEMLSDPNFRGDWGDLLGDGGGGFVPM